MKNLLVGSVIFLTGFLQVYGTSTRDLETNSTSSDLELLIQKNWNNCTKLDSTNESKESCQPKSRRKRYVAFPEGSSFSVRINHQYLKNHQK